jgi:MFS family permease
VVWDRNRGGSYIGFFLATMAMFAFFLFLTYYFQQVLGYSALKAGVAFLPFPVGVIVASGIASKTLPILGPRILATGGFISALIGLLWLTQLPVESSYALHVVPAELLISLGMGHVFVPLSNSALLGVPNHDAGVASALVNTMQQVGGSIGTSVLSLIVASATTGYLSDHQGQVSAASTHGYAIAFLSATLVFAIGAVTTVSLMPARRREPVVAEDLSAASELAAVEVAN